MTDIPAFQASFRHFGVKLEGEGKVFERKCLVFVKARPGER